jgi:hypothetical protein
MDEVTRWAHRTPNLYGLSYRFAVRAQDARLGALASKLLGSLAGGDKVVEHWYSLTASPDVEGTIDVWCDAEVLARSQRPGDALGWVVWHANRGAVGASGQHLLFHAGALETASGGVLVPGATGSGKSTLVAGLARAGFGYLGDELVALDLTSVLLLSYPKPITLKRGSFALLPELHPDLGTHQGSRPWDGEQWQVPVGGETGLPLGRACAPCAVVVPHYDDLRPTTLTRLTQTEAFFTLARHTVNLLDHGAAGIAALAQLARRCPCFSLAMSDLDQACRLLSDLVCESEFAVSMHGEPGLVARGV